MVLIVMANHFNGNRKGINAAMIGSHAARSTSNSASQVAMAYATGGVASICAADTVSDLVKEAFEFLIGTKSVYLGKLQLTPVDSQTLAELLDPNNSGCNVVAYGKASLPLAHHTMLSTLTDVARHEVCFFYLEDFMSELNTTSALVSCYCCMPSIALCVTNML